MKVLMFGWEFPPHISGGLGTACFGLTQSLAKENTDILFVVPKADDHRPFDGVDVISASNVPLPISDEEIFSVVSSSDILTLEKTASRVTSIQITSELQPYFFNESPLEVLNLEQWNYQLPESRSTTSLKKELGRKMAYSFSGGYGAHLL
jgi:glycogen synthase